MSFQLPLGSVAVRFNASITAGTIVFLGGSAWFRHFSEFALCASRAQWHPNRSTCPTWDDATECRCMLGGEA